MKRKICVCAVLAGIVAALSLGTAAYFTTDGTAVHAITAGNIRVELLETAERDGQTEKIPYENTVSVVPDTSVSKIVTVKNTGAHAEYVRVWVDKTISSADAVQDGSSLIETDFNTEYWTERGGYWYYNKVLESGQETEPLFTTVVFDKGMRNEYQNGTAVIEVKAFGVQSEHNGGSPTEAVGWPENK